MQIDFLGANCLKIKTNGITLVFDDNLLSLGGKAVTTAQDIVCITNPQLIEPPQLAQIVFDTPGSYEVSDVLIDGIRAQAFLSLSDETPSMSATIYKVVSENISLAIVGHIQPTLNEEQLAELDAVDILFIPVGGHGYTLDAQGAAQIVKSINPRLVIPTHFAQKGLKFEVPPAGFEEFAKIIAPNETEIVEGSLKIKKSDLSSERLTLKVLV